MTNRNKEIQYKRIYNDPDGMRYELTEEYVYFSGMFNRTITIPKGRKSDGATSARDLGIKESGWRKYWAVGVEWVLARYLKYKSSKKKTASWFVHDELCIKGCWDDGTRISNFVASTVLSVILHYDGYTLEAITWFFATLLFGGGEARKNGIFWVKSS
jgi:hypothetical protein